MEEMVQAHVAAAMFEIEDDPIRWAERTRVFWANERETVLRCAEGPDDLLRMLADIDRRSRPELEVVELIEGALA